MPFPESSVCRLGILASAAIVTIAAHAQGTHRIQLPAQPLGQALNALALQTDARILFSTDLTDGKAAPAVAGSVTAQQALDQLLAGSGLVAQPQADGTWILRTAQAAVRMPGHVAQDNTLPEVRIVAPTEALASTEGTGSYTTGAVSIFKTSQSIRETPHPVTVLTQQVLRDQALTDLTSVMQNTPGVTISYTDSERVNYWSRGYQIDTIQFDGMTASQGGSTFIQPDVALLDRVEVVRGANGMLRGSGNPSATVNMVRKRPTEDLRASAELGIGSWNKRRLVADVSGALTQSGAIRGRVVAVGEDKDFFQRARDESRRVLYGVLEADLGRRTLLTAGYEFTTLDATGAWGNLPAAADGTQLGLPRSTYLGADWNTWDRINKRAFLELEHAFDNDWKAKLSLTNTQHRLKNFEQTYFYDNAASSNPYIMDVYAAIYMGDQSDQNVYSLVANGPFQLLGRRHELVVGAEISRAHSIGTSGAWNIGTLTGVDITTWDPSSSMAAPDISQGASFVGTNNRTRQQAVYATARLSLADPLTVIAGARLNWWDYAVPGNASSAYDVDNELTPYLGVVYDLARDWSLYASYSEIFTPQNRLNSSGTILDPIRGKDYEAGIKGEWFDGRLNAALSLFHITNEGAAVSDTSSSSPCLPYYTAGYCYMAGGKTRSKGWELEMQGHLTSNWQMLAGYTNTKTEYVSGSSASSVGQPLRSHDPRHLLRLTSTYRFDGALRGLALGAGVQAQSDFYAASGAVRYSHGGYSVWNAMASYAINDQWQLQFNVNNLFDKTYYKQIGSGINNYYGDPRNYLLTLRASF